MQGSKKRVLIIAAACVLVIAACAFAFVSCSKAPAADKAKALAASFSSGDIASIEEALFPGIAAQREALGGYQGGAAELELQEEFLTAVFGQAQVTAGDSKDGAVEFIVRAPDMSNIFSDAERLSSLTSGRAIARYVRDFSRDAHTVTNTVWVAYTKGKDGEIEFNFCTPDFLNALSGGFIESTSGLYTQLLEGLM